MDIIKLTLETEILKNKHRHKPHPKTTTVHLPILNTGLLSTAQLVYLQA